MDFKSRSFSSFVTKSCQFISDCTRRPKNSSRRRRASTTVETALCLTFFLIPMTIGGLQFAIVINATHTLDRFAREGGRFAAVHGGEATFDGADTQVNPPSLKAYMKSLCTGSTIPWADISNRITVTPAGSRISGQGITVSINYQMSKKIIFQSNTVTDRLGLKRLDNNYIAQATFILE